MQQIPISKLPDRGEIHSMVNTHHEGGLKRSLENITAHRLDELTAADINAEAIKPSTLGMNNPNFKG